MKNLWSLLLLIHLNFSLTFAQEKHVAPIVSSDSIKSINYKSPAFLSLGLGIQFLRGDATLKDPIYNDIQASLGLSLNTNLSIPIFKKLGVGLHYGGMFTTDEGEFQIFSIQDSGWAQYEVNNQYGIEDFKNNSILYVDFYKNYTCLELSNFLTYGPIIYLPLTKNRSVWLCTQIKTGSGKLNSIEITRTIEDGTFISGLGEEVFRAQTNMQSKKCGVNEIGTSLIFLPSKHFLMSIGFNYIKTSKVDYLLETDFYVLKELKEKFYKQYSASFQAIDVSLNLGYRF